MEKRKAGRVELKKFNVELTDIYDYVCNSLEVDIKSKRRTKLYVNGRTLFLAIATKTTKASREHMGRYINRDHSTVTFGVNRLMDDLLKEEYYMNLLTTYATLKAGKEMKQESDNKSTLVDALLEINRLKDIVSEFKAPVIPLTVHLTQNELDYRELSDQEKEEYDMRAKNVLKSFIWKRKDANRKEVFEIIKVG